MANFETPVTDYMTTPVETVRIGESLITANELFAGQGVSALGVVDGIRYGISGRGDSDLAVGVAVTLACIAVLAALSYRLFAVGYKYKT